MITVQIAEADIREKMSETSPIARKTDTEHVARP